MHGIVFAELQKFVTHVRGANAWGDLLTQAGMKNRIFVPLTAYPDAEILSLVQTASQNLNLTVDAVLDKFGAFIAPDLLNMYRTLIDPAWRTLEVLEHTEHVVHRVVRLNNSGAEPPVLTVSRKSASAVRLEYRSARKMCALARGIIKGLADHFHDQVILTEPECMHRGNSRCVLEVQSIGRTTS